MIAAPAFASSVAGALFCLKIAGVLVPALILYEILAPLPLFARWGGWLGPRLALALGVARVRYLRVRRLRGTRPGSRGPW